MSGSDSGSFILDLPSCDSCLGLIPIPGGEGDLDSDLRLRHGLGAGSGSGSDLAVVVGLDFLPPITPSFPARSGLGC